MKKKTLTSIIAMLTLVVTVHSYSQTEPASTQPGPAVDPKRQAMEDQIKKAAQVEQEAVQIITPNVQALKESYTAIYSSKDTDKEVEKGKLKTISANFDQAGEKLGLIIQIFGDLAKQVGNPILVKYIGFKVQLFEQSKKYLGVYKEISELMQKGSPQAEVDKVRKNGVAIEKQVAKLNKQMQDLEKKHPKVFQ